MQVSLETTEGLERKMTVEVPAEKMEESLATFKQMDAKYAYLVENGVDDPLVRASHILISTADATTGPAMGPLPASSLPAMIFNPFFLKVSSCR